MNPVPSQPPPSRAICRFSDDRTPILSVLNAINDKGISVTLLLLRLTRSWSVRSIPFPSPGATCFSPSPRRGVGLQRYTVHASSNQSLSNVFMLHAVAMIWGKLFTRDIASDSTFSWLYTLYEIWQCCSFFFLFLWDYADRSSFTGVQMVKSLSEVSLPAF